MPWPNGRRVRCDLVRMKAALDNQAEREVLVERLNVALSLGLEDGDELCQCCVKAQVGRDPSVRHNASSDVPA